MSLTLAVLQLRGSSSWRRLRRRMRRRVLPLLVATAHPHRSCRAGWAKSVPETADRRRILSARRRSRLLRCRWRACAQPLMRRGPFRLPPACDLLRHSPLPRSRCSWISPLTLPLRPPSAGSPGSPQCGQERRIRCVRRGPRGPPAEGIGPRGFGALIDCISLLPHRSGTRRRCAGALAALHGMLSLSAAAGSARH